MSSAGTYLAAAAAVGAASEATGTTAFTPLGERAREGFDVDAPGGGGPSTSALLAALGNAGQGGTSLDLDLGALGQQGDGGAGAVAELASQFVEQQAETFERAQERAQEEREKAEERTEEADPRDSNLWQLVEGRLEELEDGLEETTSNFEDQLDKTREEAEDRAGDGLGFGLPGLGLPSVGVPSLEGGTGATDYFVRTGNTYAEVAKALYGEEYSPENTLAEGVLGPERRRIDWSKYQIGDAPSLEDQLEKIELPERNPSGDSDDDRNLWEMAVDNVEEEIEKATGGNSSTSSSNTRASSTISTDVDHSSDRRLARAAEEIEEENRRKRNAPAGGLIL